MQLKQKNIWSQQHSSSWSVIVWDLWFAITTLVLRLHLGARWLLTIHSMQATMHYLVTFLKQDEVAGYSCLILGGLAHAWWNASI